MDLPGSRTLSTPTMLKRSTYILAFSLLASSVWGQQLPAFSHYMNNLQVINPAFTGIRQVPTFSMNHRSQWVGLPGAPITQSFLAETTIGQSVGIGFTVMNDLAGPARTTAVSLDMSYSFKIDRFKKLSFGAKVGGTKTRADLSDLSVFDQADQKFMADMADNFAPNAGAGAVYFDKWYYIGIGIPYLFEPEFRGLEPANQGSLGRLGRHFYLHVGTALENKKGVVIKPTAFLKMTANAWQLDLTCVAELRGGLWAGGGIRTSDGIRALGGYRFNRRFQVGYAFDFSISNQLPLNHFGSHELMLQYKIMTKLDEFALKPKKI